MTMLGPVFGSGNGSMASVRVSPEVLERRIGQIITGIAGNLVDSPFPELL
jgi:hypothetical protein